VTIPLVNSNVSTDALKIGKVTYAYKPIKYEIALALTFHKVQGATMDRVIISLGGSNGGRGSVTLASLFVAFSRVRRAQHLRFLPFKPEIGNRLLGLNHSMELLSYFRQVLRSTSTTGLDSGGRPAQSIAGRNSSSSSSSSSSGLPPRPVQPARRLNNNK